MTISQIIEYVMHTPGNTNPAILRSMLNSLAPDTPAGTEPIVDSAVVGQAIVSGLL